MTPRQSSRQRSVSESSGDGATVTALTKSGLPIRESLCSNPMAWRIERINPSTPNLCRGQFGGKRCGYRIAKYKRSTAAPTFTGIQRKNGRKGTEQKQFWFCPIDVTRCVMGQTRCVVHYPDIPEMWPVKVDTNLTQTEVEGLESAGFKIDDGE
jgi:hypothetical protein